MKYSSSLTKEIKLTVLFLLLFWVVNFFAITSSNGLKDALVFSLLMVCFAAVFVWVLVRGIYLVIENNHVKYSHIFVRNEILEIEKIDKVQMALMGGLYKSLLLVCLDGGGERNFKISMVTFKKNTLKRFILDLKNINRNIEVDESVDKFLAG